MIKWLLYLFPSLLYTCLCYVTNPIVVLFADEDGELPGIFRYWQTWDNPTNPSDLIDILPRWLTSWYTGHYTEYISTTPELEELGRTRWFTKCINDNFTIWQRITRYICRVYWLSRNSAYGFCFFLLGADYNPYHSFYIKQSENECFVRDSDEPSIWMYSNSKKIFGRLEWNIFLGWKLTMGAGTITRCMIANRITMKIK